MKMSAWAMGWLLLGSSAGMAVAAEWFVATNGSDAAEGTRWATASRPFKPESTRRAPTTWVWVSNGVTRPAGVRGSWERAPTGCRSIDQSRAPRQRSSGDPHCRRRDALRVRDERPVLSGFTLTNGTTASGMCGCRTDTVDHYGGGALCEVDGMLTNCVLTGNWACYAGGGSWGAGTIVFGRAIRRHAGRRFACRVLNIACCLKRGQLFWRGGSWKGTLNHCLLTHNYGARPVVGAPIRH
jgi:hypothetical protein